MNKKAQIQDTLKLVSIILVALLFIAILAITAFLVLTNLTPAITSMATSTGSQSLNAVTGIGVNGTGYNFADCLAKYSGKLTSVVAVNYTGGALGATNYTLSNCNIVGTAPDSNRLWNITSGTFTYIITSEQATQVSNNVTSGIAGFFTQIPTVFTVLGIIVLIGAIILIIVFVRKMSGTGGGGVGL